MTEGIRAIKSLENVDAYIEKLEIQLATTNQLLGIAIDKAGGKILYSRKDVIGKPLTPYNDRLSDPTDEFDMVMKVQR